MYWIIIGLWVGLIVFNIGMLYIQIFGERSKGIMAAELFVIVLMSTGTGALLVSILLGAI